jgi:hypothetical protein
MSDFYRDSAERRLQQLTANRAATLADLEAHKLNDDYDAAAECIQQIADLDAAKQNLVDLHQRYVAANTPPAPEQLSDEEKHAKPWNRMTPQDALDLAKTSRYGKSLDFNDPHVIAGWHEAHRRKARGE